MLNLYLNKLKLDKLKQIENNYKYLYFFRYNDLNYNDILFLKKTKKINFFCLKQNLIKSRFINLKGQGSVFILYSNILIPITFFQKLKKIKLIYILYKNNIFSNLKINKNKNQTNLIFYAHLKKPFYLFYSYLLMIK